MFDPQKLTALSSQTLNQAITTAQSQSHSTLEPLHLLHALLTTDGPAREILRTLIPDTLNSLQEKIDAQLSLLPHTSTPTQPAISPNLKTVLDHASSLMSSLNDEYLSQELLLQTALKDPTINQLISPFNLKVQDVEKEITAMRQGNTVDSPTKDATYKTLDKYTLNFTALAREGKLDPVIGRDQEIRRVIQVLSRRTKNNPVLIGEPGVGKTAIVEGLAQRIVSGDVPLSLKHKQVLNLEISSVLAGAKFRGEFEERFKAIIDEVQKHEGEIILFIDELHTVVGAGNSQGAVDASNMLKPGLARGTLRVIGATTLNEYRQYIEKDAALERRFQPVLVNPPSVEDTVSILRGLKEKYELHHGIRIQDDALIAAATLSDRYIQDRFLPDKAIDLIDEAASALKIQAESQPESLDTLNRQITQLEIEKKALQKEKNSDGKSKLKTLEKQLSDLKQQHTTLTSRWQQQKALLDTIQEYRNKIDEAKAALERAEREVNLDEAAKIKYGDLPQLQRQLETHEKKFKSLNPEELLIKQEVTQDDIASVVARWTGVPVTKLIKSETDKLVNLETDLRSQVIGQDEALRAVSNAIIRSRAGLSEENRPQATFLFIGPTGVGKTETAKVLADVLFNDRRALVRLDMSEYSERHSVARLVGAPPGYVGYEEGGQLTESVRRKPYSILLLDEIEKAHPAIFNLMLQIFDDGQLTDGQGRTVNFKNTIIIMTSNLGAKIISESKGSIDENVKNQITDLINQTFPPEFINRLDQIIMYEPLSQTDIVKIVDKELHLLKKRLANQDISLDVDTEVKKYLAEAGFDPIYGARPLKRVTQAEIIDPLASFMIRSQGSKNKFQAILKDGTIFIN